MSLLDPLPMSLRQLQYLVAVADLGGFRRAADACRVAQPSLSAQVAQAEAALGVRIFERDRRGVRPSAAGLSLIAQARTILMAASDLRALARQAADPFAGTFRVGVIPTISPYLLPDVAPSLSRAYPSLTLAWTEERTGALVRQLYNGTLDAAILAVEADLGGLEHEVLLDDGHCFRDQALQLCSRVGAHESGFRATSLATLVQMASAGRGATLLPAIALPVENRRGQLVVRPFTPPGPGRTIALAWRRGSALAVPLRALALSMRAALASAHAVA